MIPLGLIPNLYALFIKDKTDECLNYLTLRIYLLI